MFFTWLRMKKKKKNYDYRKTQSQLKAKIFLIKYEKENIQNLYYYKAQMCQKNL